MTSIYGGIYQGAEGNMRLKKETAVVHGACFHEDDRHVIILKQNTNCGDLVFFS